MNDKTENTLFFIEKQKTLFHQISAFHSIFQYIVILQHLGHDISKAWNLIPIKKNLVCTFIKDVINRLTPSF